MTSPTRYPTTNSDVSLGIENWTRYKASALDVHKVLYTMSTSHTAADPEQFDLVKTTIEGVYEHDSVYQNPVLTASNRTIIAELHAGFNSLLVWNFPRPPPALLFWKSTPSTANKPHEPLFRIYHIWSEVIDVGESESFDRTRKVYLEHVLHVLLFPGLHRRPNNNDSASGSSVDSLVPTSSSQIHLNGRLQQPPMPYLHQLGPHFPNPLHFSVRITSLLRFNDVGKITNHQDLVDVRDLVLLLVPGLRAFLWIFSRLCAFTLVALLRIGKWISGCLHSTVKGGRENTSKPYGNSLIYPVASSSATPIAAGDRDSSSAQTTAGEMNPSAVNSLGLRGVTGDGGTPFQNSDSLIQRRPDRSDSTSVDIQ